MAIRREDLKGLNFRDVATGRRLAPVHPGEVLKKDFIEPMALTRYKVAKLAGVQESTVRQMLVTLADDMATLERDCLKDFLGGFIEKIVLDPATRAGSIRYRIGASGVKVASPRGFEPRLPP